jgi:hypothetical protein
MITADCPSGSAVVLKSRRSIGNLMTVPMTSSDAAAVPLAPDQ